eukprot:GSMAST32.ASY1.ANO1.1190.1 assembled CDS
MSHIQSENDIGSIKENVISTVLESNAKRRRVSFSSESIITNKTSEMHTPPSTFSVGDFVEAMWNCGESEEYGKAYFPATIIDINYLSEGNWTYNLLFDDGSEDTSVVISSIRPRDTPDSQGKTPNSTIEKPNHRAHLRRSSAKTPPLPFRFINLFSRPQPLTQRAKRRTLSLVSRKPAPENPNIFTIDEFLTESELLHLRSIITNEKNRFQSSFTEDDDLASHVSSDRTSRFIFLKKGQDTVVRAVERRAAEILGVPPQNVEPLQIVSYTMGQKFNVHHVCFHHEFQFFFHTKCCT